MVLADRQVEAAELSKGSMSCHQTSYKDSKQDLSIKRLRSMGAAFVDFAQICLNRFNKNRKDMCRVVTMATTEVVVVLTFLKIPVWTESLKISN